MCGERTELCICLQNALINQIILSCTWNYLTDKFKDTKKKAKKLLTSRWQNHQLTCRHIFFVVDKTYCTLNIFVLLCLVVTEQACGCCHCATLVSRMTRLLSTETECQRKWTTDSAGNSSSVQEAEASFWICFFCIYVLNCETFFSKLQSPTLKVQKARLLLCPVALAGVSAASDSC